MCVYVFVSFDMVHFGHANALRQVSVANLLLTSVTDRELSVL